MFSCNTTNRFDRAERAISSRCFSRHARWIFVAWWLTTIVSSLAIAQDPNAGSVIDREYAIKAAFLYNFLKYLQWPANATPAEGKPFVIGVFQDDPFDKALDTIAKKVAGHPTEIALSSIEGVRVSTCSFLGAAMPQQNAVLRRAIPVFVVRRMMIFAAGGTHSSIWKRQSSLRR
jgi:hypothetical protein